MAICIGAIVIGTWVMREDVVWRFPRVIKVSLSDSSLDPAY